MQSTLFGKNFITTEDWSNDEIKSLMDVAGDLKRRFSMGEIHDHILRIKPCSCSSLKNQRGHAIPSRPITNWAGTPIT